MSTILLRAAALSLLGLVTVLASAGCDEVLDRVGGDSSADAELAIESVALTELEATILVAVVDGMELVETEGQTAALVADAAESTFTPSDCVMAEAIGGTVTYNFDDCSGPRGLSGLDGIAVFTVAVPTDDSVAVTFTSSDFVVNGTDVTLSAQGEYSRRGGNQELTLETTGGGLSDAGDIITRAGTYTATWTDTCVTIQGGWTTQEGTTNYNTSLTGYTHCTGSCPDDGGRVVFTELATDDTELDGSAITVSYDGDSEATYVSTSGAPGTVTLDCQ